MRFDVEAGKAIPPVAGIPLLAAVWLLGSGLALLAGFGQKKRSAA